MIAGVILDMFCGCRVAASKTAFKSFIKSALFNCRFDKKAGITLSLLFYYLPYADVC